MSRNLFKHCPTCGAAVVYSVPVGDNRDRAVCTACSTVHYQNPLTVVGTVPTWGQQVLLCRRAIEPRHGFWTLPAGFMELGETTAEGAARETLEEAGADITMGPLYTVLNVTRVGQVHLFYRATLNHTAFDPGPESLEAKLFSEADIPWGDLAFRTVERTLRHHFEDLARGSFGVHCGDIS
jgi:ADP-ribose pyrophosphatase YjhB (NUDIX family)